MDRFISRNVSQTIEYGKKFSKKLFPGDCVFLYGDVGAGKTVFVRGLARGFNIAADVTSPSFAIIQEYEGAVPLYHVDLYRITPSDVCFLGLEEYFERKGITAIEWADRLGEPVHERTWKITISHRAETERLITVQCPKRRKKKIQKK